jgi:hypothetical protein
VEQQAGLSIAQERHIGAAVTRLPYYDGEPMAFVLEARPTLVQLGGCNGHALSHSWIFSADATGSKLICSIAT